jgi:hypothetical protein
MSRPQRRHKNWHKLSISTGNSELYCKNTVRDSDYKELAVNLPVDNYSKTWGNLVDKLLKTVYTYTITNTVLGEIVYVVNVWDSV